MKKNICSVCGRTIDRNDFYSVVRFEKVCSECLVESVVNEAERELKQGKRKNPEYRVAM